MKRIRPTPENAPPGAKIRALKAFKTAAGRDTEIVVGNDYIIKEWNAAEGIRLEEKQHSFWRADWFELVNPAPCGRSYPARRSDDPFPTVASVCAGYKKEGKPDYSYLCRDMLDDLASGMEKGGTKHGRLNYLTNPLVTDQEILAAARRHALEDPEKIDDGPGGTGLPHRALAMANFAMLTHRAAARKRGEIK